jgi:sugar transferase (PEP-CTERM/EpsH1 system associated)
MRWVYQAEARRLAQVEAGRHDRFDAVTVTTGAEAETYRNTVGGDIQPHVVTNGVDLKYFEVQPDANSKTIVFVGVLDYRPNVDGIVWFVENVMPRMRQVEPEAQLMIVGRHPTQRVHDLDGRPGVEVVGSVPDVRYYLAQAAAVIAPLRIARGVQNKVLEAMASRRVAVCSPGAACGIDASDGEHLVVADEPQQWVEHIQRIFTDDQWRNRLAASARQRVEQRYNWSSCLQPMVELINADHEGKHAA